MSGKYHATGPRKDGHTSAIITPSYWFKKALTPSKPLFQNPLSICRNEKFVFCWKFHLKWTSTEDCAGQGEISWKHPESRTRGLPRKCPCKDRDFWQVQQTWVFVLTPPIQLAPDGCSKRIEKRSIRGSEDNNKRHTFFSSKCHKCYLLGPSHKNVRNENRTGENAPQRYSCDEMRVEVPIQMNTVTSMQYIVLNFPWLWQKLCWQLPWVTGGVKAPRTPFWWGVLKPLEPHSVQTCVEAIRLLNKPFHFGETPTSQYNA